MLTVEVRDFPGVWECSSVSVDSILAKLLSAVYILYLLA